MPKQAIGGPEGEMRVALQYLLQAWGARGPKQYRRHAAPCGHRGARAHRAAGDGRSDEPRRRLRRHDRRRRARSGGRRAHGRHGPRHFLSVGLAAMPADANGVPFNANCIDVGGNLTANLRANVAAEAIGRTLAARLRDWTDDPGMKDMLSFLIARDTMHQQQWLAAIEQLGDTNQSAPNRRPRRGRVRAVRLCVLRPRRRADGPRGALAHRPLDGRQGRVHLHQSGPGLRRRPRTSSPGPPFAHGGIEATRDANGNLAQKIQES
jgi:Mn-containing catalase